MLQRIPVCRYSIRFATVAPSCRIVGLSGEPTDDHAVLQRGDGDELVAAGQVQGTPSACLATSARASSRVPRAVFRSRHSSGVRGTGRPCADEESERDFEVRSSNCRAQWLRLELAARTVVEQPAGGEVWFDGLAIERAGVPAPPGRP